MKKNELVNSKVLEIGAEARFFLTSTRYMDPIKEIAYSLTLDRYSEWLIDQEKIRANWNS